MSIQHAMESTERAILICYVDEKRDLRWICTDKEGCIFDEMESFYSPVDAVSKFVGVPVKATGYEIDNIVAIDRILRGVSGRHFVCEWYPKITTSGPGDWLRPFDALVSFSHQLVS